MILKEVKYEELDKSNVEFFLECIIRNYSKEYDNFYITYYTPQYQNDLAFGLNFGVCSNENVEKYSQYAIVLKREALLELFDKNDKDIIKFKEELEILNSRAYNKYNKILRKHYLDYI